MCCMEVQLLTNALCAHGGAPVENLAEGPRESALASTENRYPVYISHAVHLPPYYFCVSYALVHILLWTEILLLENKRDIIAQFRSDLHAKEATADFSDSVFQVARSVLHTSRSFAFTAERVPCQAAHTARPRSGVVLLTHIRLPRSNPSHLTAPRAKCL